MWMGLKMPSWCVSGGFHAESVAASPAVRLLWCRRRALRGGISCGGMVCVCCLCCFGVGSVGGGSALLRRRLLSGCGLSRVGGCRLTWMGLVGMALMEFCAVCSWPVGWVWPALVDPTAGVGGLDGFTGGKAEKDVAARLLGEDPR